MEMLKFSPAEISHKNYTNIIQFLHKFFLTEILYDTAQMKMLTLSPFLVLIENSPKIKFYLSKECSFSMRKLAMKSIQDPRPNHVSSDFVQFFLLLDTLFWETPFFERGLHNMLTLFWSCNQAIEEFLPFVNCHQTQTPWPHLWVDLAVKPGFSGLCNTILLGGWENNRLCVFGGRSSVFSLEYCSAAW